MRVVVRVDASPAIGLGHVVRSLCLARRLVDHGAVVRVLTSSPSSAVVRRIEAAGAEVVPLDEVPGSPEDAARTVEAARASAVVVVDGYAFGAEYMQRLARGRVPTVQIDDAGGAVADVIVNGNLHAEGMDYPGAGLSLVGPRWALLDPRFVRVHALPRRAPFDPPRLVVSMGGADPTRETCKVLRALDRLPPWPCTIVVGALAPHAPEIRLAALDRSQRAPTTIVEDVDDMAALFASHDLAVAAAGTSALELACAGIPAALVAVADNQRPVLSAAARLGCAAALGWHGDVDEARIADCLSALAKDLPLRTTMAARGRELVDGAGAERVANKIIHLARIRAAS